jgi:hypothetical protein
VLALLHSKDKQVTERRLRMTAVVSEAKAKRTQQSMIAQAGKTEKG